MTTQTDEKLRQLAENITPLPWVVCKNKTFIRIANPQTDREEHAIVRVFQRPTETRERKEANSTYIVAACNAVPSLLDRLAAYEQAEKTGVAVMREAGGALIKCGEKIDALKLEIAALTKSNAEYHAAVVKQTFDPMELERVKGELVTLTKALANTKAELDYRKAAHLQQRPPMTPRLVQLHDAVRGDGPLASIQAPPGIYAAICNQWGAVSVRATNGSILGCRWPDFEPIEWEPNPYIAKPPKGAK